MLLNSKASVVNYNYKPIFYKPGIQGQGQRLKDLLREKPQLQIYDTFESQVKELIKIENPGKQLSPAELQQLVQEYFDGKNSDELGVWVYYPWADKVVHLLDEEDFIKVRTNRNIYKITPEELTVLRQKRVGIIGLSVGQAIALSIATERICSEMHLADFDNIELNNMNRLSNTNVFDIGMPKVVVTARRIAELDPFITVTCFTEGITETNMDTFLGTGNSKLDVLIEECDGINIKILSRIKAKQKGIPVVMDFNDKGMLDVERFDLEPDRPILHGRLQDLEALGEEALIQLLKKLTFEQRVQYLAQMIGMENTTAEMRRSLPEMGKTITGWPQIASAIFLGGAMVTDTCRRILLGKFTASGRYFVHFDDLIN